MKLSIIIPVYNEEKTIYRVLEDVTSIYIKEDIAEIIVVDDGSTDDTGSGVLEFIEKNEHTKIKFVRKKNNGKGSAIKEALKHVTGDYIVVQDADREYDPHDLEKMWNVVKTEKIPVVYGSRILNSNNRKSYFSYYWGGRLLSWLTTLLYGYHITDESTCYKMIKKSLLDEIGLYYDGFEFCPEVTGKILKRKIPVREIPIKYYPRSREDGKKIKWLDGIKAIWVLIKMRFSK